MPWHPKPPARVLWKCFQTVGRSRTSSRDPGISTHPSGRRSVELRDPFTVTKYSSYNSNIISTQIMEYHELHTLRVLYQERTFRFLKKYWIIGKIECWKVHLWTSRAKYLLPRSISVTSFNLPRFRYVAAQSLRFNSERWNTIGRGFHLFNLLKPILFHITRREIFQGRKSTVPSFLHL